MKAVLFDVDGTLIDSGAGIMKSAKYSLEKMGIEVGDYTELRFFVGPPLWHTYSTYYGMNKEEADKAVAAYRERYNDYGYKECELYPGVESCIQELKAQGYRICTASSKPEGMCKKILEELGVAHLFDEIIGATEDSSRSSKEAVLEYITEIWNDIPKNQMVLIGDTIFDVNGAVAAGMPCIAVTFGFGDVEEMKAAGANGVCDSLWELPACLEKMWEGLVE